MSQRQRRGTRHGTPVLGVAFHRRDARATVVAARGTARWCRRATILLLLLLGTRVAAFAQSSPIPSRLEFGAHTLNQPSAALSATFRNGTTVPIGVSTAIRGEAAADYAAGGNCPAGPATLAAEKSCTISVIFTPSAAGLRSATLTISDTTHEATQSFSLTGTGVSSLGIAADGGNFGIDTVGLNAHEGGRVLEASVPAKDSARRPTRPAVSTGSGILPGGLAPSSSTVSAIGLVSIVVTPLNSSISAGGTQQFTATGVYSDGATTNLTSAVGWSSSTLSVAAINGAGLATAAAQGSTVIMASYAAVSSPPTVKANAVTVAAPPIVISGPSTLSGSTTLTVTAPDLASIAVTPANASIAIGSAQQFTATGMYSSGTTQNLTGTGTWTSSNPAVATINSAGLASALAVGQTTITATSGGNSGSTVLTITAGFAPTTGSMNPGRAWHTATLLENGSVLIAGGESVANGSEAANNYLYNPVTGSFVLTGNLNDQRYQHTATLLPNGTVLLTGGENSGPVGSAEIYYPETASFSYTAGSLLQPRYEHTATLLPNGQVLIAAGANGCCGNPINYAELYNPATGTFAYTTNASTGAQTVLNTARLGHTATLLPNGMVLIVGGNTANNGQTPTAAAELFNPSTGVFTNTGSLNTARYNHTATLLNSGMVLIAGGYGCSGNGCTPAALNSAEIYDPNSGTFTNTGTMDAPRFQHTATLLPNGTVLLVGGTGATNETEELYDPATATFDTTAGLANGVFSATATLLNNGQVFITGGETASNVMLGTAEIYSPATLTPPNLVSIALAPTNPSIPLGGSMQFTATGTFSDGASEQLAAVNWTSSNPGAVSVSNDATNAGTAFAITGSSAVISACAGPICGSTSVKVGPALVSISISPAVTTIPIGAVAQFTATGNYSDGSTRNLTAAVAWNSSNTSAATVSNSSGSQGLASPVCGGVSTACTGTTTISATFGTIMGSAALTVETDVAYAGTLVTHRSQHTATLLNNGLVLLAGGCQADNVCPLAAAELYNPATGTFTSTGSLNTARYEHTATLLPNGTVLIAGGCVGTYCTPTASAELYNPATGIFTPTGSLNTARNAHTATLLPDGQVLIAGGGGCYYSTSNCPLQSAELYNPATGTFVYTTGYNGNPLVGGTLVQSTMTVTRVGHTATLLPNGLVVIAGGYVGSSDITNSAEVYCTVNVGPCSTSYFLGTFQSIRGMNSARADHTATMLNDGLVLMAGGTNGSSTVGEAELLNPTSLTFSETGTLNEPRAGQTATLLNNGQVLISGGGVALCCAYNNYGNQELYNPLTGTFAATGQLNTQIAEDTATLLSNGSVLIAGGNTTAGGNSDVLQAELYTPATLTPPNLVSITVTPATFALPLNSAQSFVATGTFSDGSTEQLAEVVWTSSNPGVVSITNDASDPGAGFALGSGAATLTACAGSVCGSAAVTVAPQVLSISVSPSSDTLPVGSQVQFYASGVYSDGTTRDVTSLALWSSSVSSFATISPQGVATGLSGGSTTITAALGPVQGSASLNVAAAVIGQTATADNMSFGRVGHTSTMLNLGQVLVAGGYDATGYVAQAELYTSNNSSTPNTGSFSIAGVGSLNTPRYGHTATLLDNGQVLIAGGFANGYALGSAELYIPSTETFAYTNAGPAAGLNTPRYAHTATMLPNGLVLIAGGIDSTGYPTATAELYDRTTQTFTPTGSMTLPRFWHTATLLPNGLVLIAGGSDELNDPISTAEIYNPNTGVFTPAGALNTARFLHTATLLNNGLVLLAGGFGAPGFLNSAEVYNFATGTFRPTGNLNIARDGHTATLLSSGSVLVAGGQNQDYLSSEEVFDPNSETFALSVNLPVAVSGATATLLADGSGDVLIAGGLGDGGYFDTASLYEPATLTPPGLISFNIVPALVDTVTVGMSLQNTLRFSVEGIFADGSTELLHAVTWNSLNTSLLRISNDAGNPGASLDISGAPSASVVSITATVGGITNFTSVNLRSSGFVPATNQTGNPVILNTAREQHTATLLNNGMVLVAGGTGVSGNSLNAAELYNPATGAFTETGSMNSARSSHTATLLSNGMVLMAAAATPPRSCTIPPREPSRTPPDPCRPRATVTRRRC